MYRNVNCFMYKAKPTKVKPSQTKPNHTKPNHITMHNYIAIKNLDSSKTPKRSPQLSPKLTASPSFSLSLFLSLSTVPLFLLMLLWVVHLLLCWSCVSYRNGLPVLITVGVGSNNCKILVTIWFVISTVEMLPSKRL